MALRPCASGSGGGVGAWKSKLDSIVSYHCSWADPRRRGIQVTMKNALGRSWPNTGRSANWMCIVNRPVASLLKSNETVQYHKSISSVGARGMTTTSSAGVSEDLKEQGRSAQKRRAILDAATVVF